MSMFIDHILYFAITLGIGIAIGLKISPNVVRLQKERKKGRIEG